MNQFLVERLMKKELKATTNQINLEKEPSTITIITIVMKIMIVKLPILSLSMRISIEFVNENIY